MLKLIEGSYASLFPREMDAMFRNRAEIFGERLGWEVVVKDGYERDRFDDLNPLYLVSVDPATGAYWGSLRLLPTTGPNMLRDVFPQLLEEGEVVGRARRSGRARASARWRRPGSRSGRPASHKRFNPTETLTAGRNASRHLRRLARSRNWTALPAVLERLFRPDGGR